LPSTTVRRLALLGATTVASLACAALVAAEGVGEGGDRPHAATAQAESAAPAVMIDPPLFAKQVVIGPDHVAPTTPSTGAPAQTPRLQTAEVHDGATTTTALPVPQSDPTTAPAADAAPPRETAPPQPAGARCIVRLHGKGGGAGATRTTGDGVVEVAPGGNGSAWGGREWAYFPESGYAAARAAVTSAADAAGCARIIVVGFSNGGAFAAKLYCRGETFGGRLVGVIVDDPVVDHAVEGCGPAGGVRAALYWSGALAATSVPGWNCADQDWTCEGGTTIGIDAYAASIGVGAKPSATTAHAAYQSPPELTSWW
jgi:hypothetical protein